MHRGPRRLLDMLAIKDVAADMKLEQGAKAPRHANHRAALMIKMNHRRGWKIVATISSISYPFTVIRVDVIRQAPVKLSDLLNNLARDHNRGTGHITGNERPHWITV